MAPRPIRRAQELVEGNFQRRITTEELASLAFMGRRHFEFRFRKATFNTALEYIQRVKIEAAKMSLESSCENVRNVREVRFSGGYSDTEAFRSRFKGLTGLSPMEYRTKYNRRAVAA